MSEKPPDELLRLDGLEIFRDVAPEVMEQVIRQARRGRCRRANFCSMSAIHPTPFTSLRRAYSDLDRFGRWRRGDAECANRRAIFGEIGMLDGSVRTAGASAMTRRSSSASRARPFLARWTSAPNSPAMSSHSFQRLRWTTARVEDAVLRPAPQRLARLLGHLAQEHSRKTPRGHEITIKLTQGELAQWTAMSRESLNKLLHRWIDEGVVFQEKGVLTICNVDLLEELGEFRRICDALTPACPARPRRA